MPKYYFHIREGEHFILRDEGMELQDIEAARHEAEEGLRDLVAERIKGRQRTAGLRLEVLDDAGKVVHSVRVNDVLGPVPNHPKSTH